MISTNLLCLTAQIVTAHAEHNKVAADALPDMIHSVYRALSTAHEPKAEPAAQQSPSAPVKKSVFPDFIVCLEDGRKLKMLRRHLQINYGLTPDAYREVAPV